MEVYNDLLSFPSLVVRADMKGSYTFTKLPFAVCNLELNSKGQGRKKKCGGHHSLGMATVSVSACKSMLLDGLCSHFVAVSSGRKPTKAGLECWSKCFPKRMKLSKSSLVSHHFSIGLPHGVRYVWRDCFMCLPVCIGILQERASSNEHAWIIF